MENHNVRFHFPIRCTNLLTAAYCRGTNLVALQKLIQQYLACHPIITETYLPNQQEIDKISPHILLILHHKHKKASCITYKLIVLIDRCLRNTKTKEKKKKNRLQTREEKKKKSSCSQADRSLKIKLFLEGPSAKTVNLPFMGGLAYYRQALTRTH